MKFLDRNNPRFTADEIKQVAKELYGLEGSFKELYSERDQNIRFDPREGRPVVLKIANADELPGVLDFQTKAMRHIERVDPTLPIPRVIETLAGEAFTAVTHPNGTQHFVRAISYLSGEPIDNVGASSSLRANIGRMMARTDLALRSFFHPHANQEMLWDITQCAKLQPHAQFIKNDKVRAIVEECFAFFLANTLPKLKTMRHQIIHADGHGGNLLTDPHHSDSVIGLLDFGDMLHAPLMLEPMIAANVRGVPASRLVASLCATISAYDSVLPLEEAEIEQTYDCILMRLGITATIIAWRDSVTADQPNFIPETAPKVWQSIQDMHEIGRDHIIEAVRKACRFPFRSTQARVDASKSLSERRQQVLGQHLAHFYSNPVHLEQGAGVWLYGPNGEKYLDGYNNVPVVGHCHPHVVRAISRQIKTLNTHTRYFYSTVVEYAEKLVNTFPDEQLNVATFVNSGSEANDIAYRMATYLTGNQGAIVMEGAYHGITHTIKPLSPSRQMPSNPRHVKTLRCPDLLRDNCSVAAYVADVDRAIDELAEDGMKPALFMLDSLFVSNGGPAIPEGYVTAVVEKVRAAGGVFIADEVQSGFGRSGEAMWGYQLHKVNPDFVTMGKPIGNGYPLGAIITSADNLNRFVSKVGLFSTFGGNPVACAAGLAVLDVFENENIIQNAKETGAYLLAGIKALMAQYPLIGDVRGSGLMVSVELVKDVQSKAPAIDEAKQIINLMRDEGVLISVGGPLGHVLKIRPPLVFQREHADIMISALDKSLNFLK